MNTLRMRGILLGARRVAQDLAGTAITLAAALATGFGLPSVSAVEPGAADVRPQAAAPSDSRRVSLTSFQALNAGGQVLVRWETAVELGTLGFDLFRQAGGEWVKVNPGLVPAQDAVAGGRYHQLDTSAAAPGSHRYRLVVTLNTGRTLELRTAQLQAAESIDAQDLPPQISQPRVAPHAPLPPEPTGSRSVSLAGPPPAVDLTTSSAKVKILTTAQGMHFMSTASLASLLGQPAGTVQGWIDGGDITMSNKGQPVNFVPTNGWVAANTMGPGIYFYAEATKDNYTTTNVYWILGGQNVYQTVDGGDPAPATPGPYSATLDTESEVKVGLSIVQNPEDDFWFWTTLTANSVADTFSTTFTVDRLVRTPGTTAALTVRLYGGSLTDHRVEVTLNGVLLGTRNWSGLAPYEALFTFDATSSVNLKDNAAGQGMNTLVIKALKPGALDTSVWLDGFGLSFKRTYYSGQGRQEAGADGNATVTVPNFSAAAGFGTLATNIHVFDVTNVRQIKEITNIRVDKPGTTWQASFAPSSPTMRFVMVQPVLAASTTVLSVPSARISVEYPPNLSDATTRASYVVIAPSEARSPGLLAGAQLLANYRSSEFRTKVVVIDDVYEEFSHGLITPYAIKSFIETAYANWAIRPRYFLFVGEGSYDYRNLTGSGDNLIPPRMTTHAYGLLASDSLFSNVLNDGMFRVIVARLPVKTAAELTTVFNKIQSYEAETITGGMKALAIADQPDAAGDFISGIEEVEGFLSPTYTTQLVHPDYAPAAIDIPTLQGQIQTAMNGGVDVVNYIGHGAIDHLGSNGFYFMEVAQPQTLVPTLANGARLPVFVAMTCVAGNFAQPGWTSFGEALVRQSGAGAVAAIAPTGLSQDDEAAWINRRIMELFACNTSGRLGDVFAQSASLYNAGTPRLTPVWIYGILGDPALKIVTP